MFRAEKCLKSFTTEKEKLMHSTQFRARRFANWFPMGLLYALGYMASYNLTVGKMFLGDIMTKSDFGWIFGVGAWVYGLSFLINGPLIDRIGGRKGILIGGLGVCLANLTEGFYLNHVLSLEDPKTAPLGMVFTIIYGINMYFRSYLAVAVVKVNSNWFHVKERGQFSGFFGAMISMGLYLAFDGNKFIVEYVSRHFDMSVLKATTTIFFGPAILLAVFLVVESLLLKDRPSDAGLQDFDPGDASSGKDSSIQPSAKGVLKRMLTNPIVLTIAFVEFCTGVLRNGVMHWFPIFGKEEHLKKGITEGWQYFSDNWGLMLMIAGITGGMVAGYMSDRVFQSRRAPTAGFLYLGCLAATLLMIPFLENGWVLGVIVFVVQMCVIGTHGVLSGTATMDFGGRKEAGTAVAIVDGFVYLGTGLQSLALGYITTRNWAWWPIFLVPFSLIGFYLLTRIWNALPNRAQKKEA